MCGVIYFQGNGEKYKDLLARLLHESRVRGLHAFGVSVRGSPNRSSFEKTVRTYELEQAEHFIMSGNYCELIGHTRYDTSGDFRVLSNNQPLVVGENILAFNGVIRMCLKEEYELEFNRKYRTANDGEILLQMFAEERSDLALHLLQSARVSFAGVVHTQAGSFALRNPRRPLWLAGTQDATFAFSTRDIWTRTIEKMKNSSLLSNGRLKFWLREVQPMEVVWLSR